MEETQGAPTAGQPPSNKPNCGWFQDSQEDLLPTNCSLTDKKPNNLVQNGRATWPALE